jgi:nucleoside-diphosphate-sugar epimerase
VEGVEGQVMNLGTGQEIRIGELAEKIIQKTGREVEIVVDSDRLRPQASEVMRLISDNSLARKSLGWEPQISLDDGLDRTIEWMKTHLDLYRIGKYEF